MDVFERATIDIEAGRLWKARDRLHGYLASRPADQKALDLLGSILFRMGDLPRAGAYWFMTESVGAEAEAAQAALYERYSKHPAQLLANLPIRGPLLDYPVAVQARLGDLGEKAGGWPRDELELRRPKGRDERPRSRVMESVTVAALFVGIFGVWLAGVVFLLGLIVEVVT